MGNEIYTIYLFIFIFFYLFIIIITYLHLIVVCAKMKNLYYFHENVLNLHFVKDFFFTLMPVPAVNLNRHVVIFYTVMYKYMCTTCIYTITEAHNELSLYFIIIALKSMRFT